MDLRTYYQKIRAEEAAISTEFAVVASRQTDDGGKGGLLMEVPRYLAAKMLVEGSALMATVEQAETFREQQCAALKAAVEKTAAQVAISVVSSEELKKLTDDVRALKER